MMVSGMTFKFRYRVLAHDDLNYPRRDWNGYSVFGHTEMWY